MRKKVLLATVLRICAWCSAVLGSYEDDNAKPGSVSHGICTKCVEEMKRK